MKPQKANKTKIIFQNIFIVFFLIVIALSAVSYFLSRFYFNELVKEKIIENFNNVNEGKYKLSIENVNTNLLRAYVLIKNAEIKKQDKCMFHKHLFIENIQIPFIEIKQISLSDLINNNYLKISHLLVQNVELNFIFNKNPKHSDTTDSIVKNYDNEKQFIREIKLDLFNLNNASLRIKNSLNDSIIFSAKGFDIELKDIKMNSVIEQHIKKIDNINDVNSLINAFKK